jgi:hypothetical protein
MRVRILSGNAAGGEQDLPQIEAEAAIATGYAEAAPELPPSEPALDEAPADPPSDEPSE